MEATDSLFEELHLLIHKECVMTAKRGKTAKEKEAIKANIRKQGEIRAKIKHIEDDYKANYESPLAEILSDRTKEEHLIAENILKNINEFPYKSDKVKAFIKGGLNDGQIFQLMDMEKENNVTMSYIGQIRQKEQ